MTLQFKSLLRGLGKFRRAGRLLFRTKKASAFFVYGSLIFNLISWALLVWLVKNEQSIVILHYNAFMGIDAIANFDDGKNYFQIFIAPIEGAFIFFLNIVIAFVLCLQSLVVDSENGKKAVQSEKVRQNDVIFFGVYLILGGSFLLQLIIFLYTIAIIWVNR